MGSVAACGDDDDDDSGADASTTSAAPEETAGDAGETAAITAMDYAYKGLPETLAVGSTLTLTNESEAELHELIAFLLPDDEKRPVSELAVLPEEELGQIFAGEPATVLLAPPGGAPQIEAVGDGTLSEAGRYIVICAIPTGADPDAYLNAPPSDGPPEVEGGPPHFTKGMYGEITVE
jgi:hypothetical protein